MTDYDSTMDTLKHSRRVDTLLLEFIAELQARLHRHDESKMHDPELATFNEYTPRLATSTYGSDEYKGYLEGMAEGLAHHYANNRHHPEHFPGGVNDMTLVDVVEMLCDWKAATERHNDGDLTRSLDIQQNRFDLSEQLKQILFNTADEAGWL